MKRKRQQRLRQPRQLSRRHPAAAAVYPKGQVLAEIARAEFAFSTFREIRGLGGGGLFAPDPTTVSRSLRRPIDDDHGIHGRRSGHTRPAFPASGLHDPPVSSSGSEEEHGGHPSRGLLPGPVLPGFSHRKRTAREIRKAGAPVGIRDFVHTKPCSASSGRPDPNSPSGMRTRGCHTGRDSEGLHLPPVPESVDRALCPDIQVPRRGT